MLINSSPWTSSQEDALGPESSSSMASLARPLTQPSPGPGAAGALLMCLCLPSVTLVILFSFQSRTKKETRNYQKPSFSLRTHRKRAAPQGGSEGRGHIDEERVGLGSTRLDPGGGQWSGEGPTRSFDFHGIPGSCVSEFSRTPRPNMVICHVLQKPASSFGLEDRSSHRHLS